MSMRTQSEPEALETEAAPGTRDPSYPDRARIDSDVRAFLRPVSTPWIVFDRDSRVDDFAKSALRVGAVFASSPTFRPEVLQAAKELGRPLEEVVAAPLPGLEAPPSIKHERMFPRATETAATTEPSNLIVASDVTGASIPDGESFVPARRTRRYRTVTIAIASSLALAAFVAIMVGRTKPNAAAAPAAQAPVVSSLSQPAEPAAEIPPPAETVELDDVAPPSDQAKRANEVRKGFGKLTIKGDAKYKNVYFDGKRMLGQGNRSFLVFCGMHTIAVTDKTEAKDIEIPCNGEFTVSK